ncbi:MAG: hypothetical protein CUR33_09320 [Pseudomonas sp.]|nr:MAG: hypothetical protein CUR33_09320 [Pseudomonas sp.] [Pseudomonas sp. FEMGT703P]
MVSLLMTGQCRGFESSAGQWFLFSSVQDGCCRLIGWYSACIALVRALADTLLYGAVRVLARTPWCINNLLITME